MIEPVTTSLFHEPSGQYVEAHIVGLTPVLAAAGVTGAWWAEDCLKESFLEPPIDRRWNWNELNIEYEGELLASERVAIIAGGAVQGAMMISAEPVASV